MAKEIKGNIDVKNVSLEQGLSWLKEILKRAKDDSLNIKSEEWTAIDKIVDKFEVDYKLKDKYYKFVKPIMTNAQKDKWIDELEGI